MTLGRSGQTQLIGVVVEVPHPHGELIDDFRREFGDPTAPLIGAHVTLVPPLEVAVESVEDIAAHIVAVGQKTAPFVVRLRGVGTFRPTSPTVFIDPVGGAAEFAALARALNAGPLHHDAEFDYRPHVTVAHFVDEHVLDAATETVAGFEAEFAATEMGLYEPAEDGRWVRILSAPFQAQ